jgi:hypothetical protein
MTASAPAGKIPCPMTSITEMLARLAELDSERREVLEELLGLGFRARSLVGEYGEMIAAAYYGVERAGPSEPGYDLEAPEVGKVQVKTLRDAPSYRRTSMGVMRDPYDTLFALRLDIHYRPVAAIEVPREVLEQLYPHGTRTSWTQALVARPGVVHIGTDELQAAADAVEAAAKAGRDRGRAADGAPFVVPITAELALRIARVDPELPRADQAAQVEAQWAAGAMSPDAVRALVDDGWHELRPLLDDIAG